MFLALIIVVLSLTGLWPRVIRGLRELRGEHVPEEEHLDHHNASDLEVCFKMFGLSPSASWEEVEEAFRRKAKIHHPDHGGDEDTMRALNDAYATLRAIKRS